MKVDRKFGFLLVGAVVIYIIFELQQPKEINWTKTFHFRDKIPFGTAVTHDLMQDMFQEKEATHVFRSLYELISVEGTDDNLMMLSNSAGFSKDDSELLLEYVLLGHTVLIGAESINGHLLDTLGLSLTYTEQLLSSNVSDVQAAILGESKTEVQFVLPGFPQQVYEFPAPAVPTHFNNVSEEDFEIIAENDEGRPVLIRYLGFENGALYLTTMPIALTNYFVLQPETRSFAEAVLSLFPEDEPLAHNEYFQMGRMESSSLIRFLLRHEALRWSYFLLIAVVVLFMLFEMKRRQRIIPIITPLKNSTLEFVETLGRLYYRQQNHSNLAQKRVLYWLDYVRSHYNLRTGELDKTFVQELVKKSGKSEKTIVNLVGLVQKIQKKEIIAQGELLAFEKLLNKFYGTE